MLRRLLFALVVLHQQARYGRAQRLLPRAQRNSNLRSRLLLIRTLRQRECAVGRVPELRHRTLQILLLVGAAIHRGNLLLAAERIVQIGSHTLELRRPCRQRIGFFVIQHVAHGQAKRIQVVLDAQQLQGVFAVAVHQIVLQFAQAGDLPRDISRVGDHRRQRNDQPEE